jgi:hypothetical protein
MAIRGLSVSHLAQAPVEVAVRAALLARGHRFDNDDVLRATAFVMTSLSPDTLRAIAANPTGSGHLLQAVIPSATANIAVNTREARNWHGPVLDPSRFGTGRSWATSHGAGFLGMGRGGRGDSDGDDECPVVRASYGLLNTRWDASRPYDLTDHNWHSSPFHGIAGLDIPTTRSLLAAGFTAPEIVRAGRDVERLGRYFGDHGRVVTTPENIARATRLNRAAPAFMGQVNRYAGALSGIREAEGGVARDEARLREMETRGEGGSEAATALRADIARRREEAHRRRQEADREINGAIEALPEGRRPDANRLLDSVREGNRASTDAASAQTREAEARARKVEAQAREVEAHAREVEAQAREAEARAREAEARAREAAEREARASAEAAAARVRPRTTAADDTFGGADAPAGNQPAVVVRTETATTTIAPPQPRPQQTARLSLTE